MIRHFADWLWSKFPGLASSVVLGAPPFIQETKLFAQLRYQSAFVTEGRRFACWWPRGPLPGNLGDVLTPLILSRLFGVVPVYAPRRPFLGVGSIIDRAYEGSVLWGSGLMSPNAVDHPGAVYLAVRGPLTRNILLQRGRTVPSVYGDPALLMPRLYPVRSSPKFAYGIVPHYKHKAEVAALPAEATLIDTLVGSPDDIYARIEQIAACEVVASSSLHGLVLAAAYGRKFVWLRDPNAVLVGDCFKFLDFFASIGLEGVEPVSWSPQDGISSDVLRRAVAASVCDEMLDSLSGALDDYLDGLD